MIGLKSKIKTRWAFKIVSVYFFISFFMAQFLSINVGSFRISLTRVIYICIIGLTMFTAFELWRIRLSYSAKFFLFWLSYQLVTLPIGLSYGLSGWIQLTYFISIYFFCTLLLIHYVDDLFTIGKLFYFLQFGIFIQMGLGLFEHTTGIYLFTSYQDLFSTQQYFLGKRFATGMQNNPNDFSMLMYFGVFISMLCKNFYTNKILKIFSIIVSIFCAYLIIINDSRAVLLGMLLSFGYILYKAIFRSKKITIAGVIYLIICEVFAIVVFVIFYKYILMFFNDNLSFSLNNTSEQIRLVKLNKGLEIFAHSLFLGVGRHGILAWHNFYIELLVECGLFVFIGFIVFYTNLFRDLNKAEKIENKVVYRTSLLIRAMLVGFLACGLSPAFTLSLEWLGAIFSLFVSFQFYIKYRYHHKGC